jgi:hypothetical protein
LWPSTTGEIPIRARSGGELADRVRRAEDYAGLGARVVVELHTESHAAKPTTRARAITRRADRRQVDRKERGERRHADCITRIDPDQPTPPTSEEGMVAMTMTSDGECLEPGPANQSGQPLRAAPPPQWAAATGSSQSIV